jgi:lactate dehydrogenase-like 2-hydroxyacid dehydrogenase
MTTISHTPPEILVLGSASSRDAMERLEREFTCHHLWRIPAAEQDDFLRRVAPTVRGVFTTGVNGISAERVAMLPALEIVAVHAIGVDAVAFDATRPRGIKVTNTPGVLTDDVADLAAALVLASARRIAQLDRYIRSGSWEGKVAIPPMRSVRGKVAGIFGFGRIGQAIGQRLEAFGMTIRYYQRSTVEGSSAIRSDSLLALAAESDYLILAAPGGAATHHAVNAQVLAALGPQGTLVNIGRGSLVDEAALIAALQRGELGAAALDVFADEPRVPAELRAMENVVMTPHIGSMTVETRDAMGHMVVDNLIAHFAGAPLLSPVP